MHTRVTINAAATTSRITNAGRPTPVIIADMLLLSCADLLAAASVTLTIVVDDGSSVYSTPQLFANGLLGRGEKIGLIFAAATNHDEYLGGGLYFVTPFGSHGSRTSALLFRSHSAPNKAPINIDDENTRQCATSGCRAQFGRTRS
jgi:hypothetical protein